FTDDSSDSFLFFPYRARIAAEGQFSKDVMGYIEFQSFGHWGDVTPIKGFQFGPVFGDNETNPSNPAFGVNPNVLQDTGSALAFGHNSVELYQAYVALNKIGGTAFSFKFGRQEMVKGSEMLLGDNDFYNGISHDGAMGSWHWDHFDLDLWWTRPLQTPSSTVTAPPTIVNPD